MPPFAACFSRATAAAPTRVAAAEPPLPPAAPAASEWRSAKRHKAPCASELGVRGRDSPLFTALIELRRQLANDEGKGTHLIASNEVLAAIASARPRAHAQLLSVRGIGRHKAEAYGKRILKCVKEHPADPTLDTKESDGVDEADGTTGEKGEGDGGGASRCELSAEQARAVSLVEGGANAFLTGGATWIAGWPMAHARAQARIGRSRRQEPPILQLALRQQP